ncbi:hypothetical protein [Bradyrhizobium sp. USDA 3364]
MKFQPARHDLATCPSEVESISAHARLATHASASAPEVLLAVAAMHSLRAVHVALSLPELIKALIDQGFSALRARRRACACVDWKAGRKTRPASSIDANLCHRHDTLCLIGRRLVRLVKMNRIVVPIVWLYAGSICAGYASR